MASKRNQDPDQNRKGDQRDHDSVTSDPSYKVAMPPDVSKDYYQFTWEDDEEADVFDREAYQLGQRDSAGFRPENSHDPHQFYDHETQNKVDMQRSISTGSAKEDIYSVPQNKKSTQRSSKLSQFGGLVLGIAQKDMNVAYTKLQANAKSQQQSDVVNNSGGTVKYMDNDPGMPDPRFSITDDFEPNEMPMTVLRAGKQSLRQGRKGHDFQAGVTVHREGEITQEDVGDLQLSNGRAHQGKYSNRIILPVDTLEMNMSSDDDDILAADDFDAHSELAPDTQAIVTVDQATLAQQWQAKSKRTKIGIILAIGGGTLLLFALVVILVVELLKASM